MADELFKQLCSVETLRIGWHLAHLDSRDDFVADPVGHDDFASHLDQRLAHLIHTIRARRYRPRYLTEIDIPKSGLSVRPGNVLPIEEATVLHAITYLLVPRLDRLLPANVHSYRLHPRWKKRAKKGKDLFRLSETTSPFLKSKTIRRLGPFVPWYIAWPEFDRLRIKAAREEGFTHLTRTDIAAYYENIDLRLLDAQLRAAIKNQSSIMELLMRILESWTRVTSAGTPIGRGIPQGNDASAILGNSYLLPLDRALSKFCRARDATWYRYVDDVEIFSKDYRTARDVVFVVNETLRQLYLNLQGSKTEIISGSDLDNELSTSELEAVEVAWEELEGVDAKAVKNRKKVNNILDNLSATVDTFTSDTPRSIKNLNKKDNRLLRRAMTLYGHCGRSDLLDVALDALRELPELRMLQKSLRYLKQLDYGVHEYISDALLSMLEEGQLPLEYQAASVIDAFRHLHPPNGGVGLAGRVSRWALRRKRGWIIRQKALELLATLPYREDYSISQAKNFLFHDHPFVRRAAAVLLTRGDVASVRGQIDSLVYDPDPSITHLALLWRRYVHDRAFGLDAIKRIGDKQPTDSKIVYELPRIWLLRCSENVDVVAELRKEVLPTLAQSRSSKIQWHYERLSRRTQWVEKAQQRQGETQES